MADLSDLLELEADDPEFVPEILPVDARLSVRGPVSTFINLFERAVSVAPTKELISGTMYSLLESYFATNSSVSHVTVSATDGQQTIAVVADSIAVAMEGAVLLPGKKVLDILKSAPTDTVRIEVVGSTATIRSGRAQWSVQTPVGDSLPPIPDVSEIQMHDVPVESFKKALTVVRRATSISEGRASLMQVQVRNGALTGSDGGRIHRMTVEGLNPNLNLAIPVKAVDELLKALRLTDSEYFSMGHDDYHLAFRIDQDILIAQRLLVPFPDMEHLLLAPTFENTNTLTVNTQELLGVIKRMRLNSDPNYAGISLSLIPGQKSEQGVLPWTLAVRARDSHGNSSQEVMDVHWVGGTKARDLTFNHVYLTDFLLSYDGEDAVFKVGNDTKAVLTPLFLEDPETGFTGIVSQIYMNWNR